MNKNIFKIDPDQDLSFISKLTDQLIYDKRADDPRKEKLRDKTFGVWLIATIFVVMPILQLLNCSGHYLASTLVTILWCVDVYVINEWSKRNEKKPLADYVVEKSAFSDRINHNLGLDHAPMLNDKTHRLMNSINVLECFAYEVGADKDIETIADGYSELTMIINGLNRLTSLGRIKGENFDKISAKYENLLEDFRNEIFTALMPDFNSAIAYEIKAGNTDFMPQRIKKALAKIYAQNLLNTADE